MVEKRIFCKCESRTAPIGDYVFKGLIIICVGFSLYHLTVYLF